jgi:hypothetical protein
MFYEKAMKITVLRFILDFKWRFPKDSKKWDKMCVINNVKGLG